MCRRGEIYYIDLGDQPGSQQGGNRPVVIVSNDMANFYAPIVTVVPLTSRRKKDLPTHVCIPLGAATGLNRTSTALAEQIMTVDKQLLGDCCGRILFPEYMDRLTKAMMIQVGAYQNA